MIRIISVAFVLALASSSTQAMPLAAIQQPDSMVTQVVAGCGVGMTRVNGVCMSRHHKRQARRCARWNGSTCAKYYWTDIVTRGFGADWSKREAASVGGLFHFGRNVRFPLVALSGHAPVRCKCPLSGAKRTLSLRTIGSQSSSGATSQKLRAPGALVWPACLSERRVGCCSPQ